MSNSRAIVLDAEIGVVGSGPGGAISACLAAEAGRSVLMVEEGQHLPIESCPMFSWEEMVTKYRRGGITVGLGTTPVAYVEGCCVGGGSEINSGLYHRCPPEILEEWRKDRNIDNLTADDLAPHQEIIERDISVSLLRGQAPAASSRLHLGAQGLGWKSLEVPRWFKYAADGSATKQSMTKTYVPRFLAADGKLVTNVAVSHVRQTSWGYEIFTRDGNNKRACFAVEKLFMSAGAIQTPAILRRSGYKHNIGQTLRMHPTVKMVAVFPEQVNDIGMGVPVHQVKEFSPEISLGCSISGPAHLALAMNDHAHHRREVCQEWRRAAIYYAMTRGGNGTVRTMPGLRDPVVRYALAPGDYEMLGVALRRLGECLLAAGATTLYASVPGTEPIRDELDLDKVCNSQNLRRASLMTIHLFGSCPMGERKEASACDSWGRLHGARNLWLADGSILGGAPGVNPQGTILALARRNITHFLNG